MKIEVDCKNESEVRQALDFLNLVVQEFLLNTPPPEEAAEEAPGVEPPKMLTPVETLEKFPASADSVPGFDPPERPNDPPEAPMLDSAGFPWSPEKHSSGKTKTVNGLWRVRALRRRKSAPAFDDKPGYADLLALVSKRIVAQKVTPDDLKDVCATVGVERLTDLADQPQKIEEAFNLINTRFVINSGGENEAVSE